MAKKKVVIIGAAGYVGIELVDTLQHNKEYELYAFTRDNGNFLLGEKQVTLLTDKDLTDDLKFDIVVNLAYPTISKAQLFPQVNQNILSTIKKLTGRDTHLIHVSTQAVFGYGMDRPIVTDFIKERRDHAYIEAKLSMEHLIKNAFPNHDISIVRLGNVWGPGSGTWTGAISEKLYFGQRVSVRGHDGFSNMTDVNNVVSYLIHLIGMDDLKGINFSHLAEFSDIKWSEVINRMATQLNVTPVYADTLPEYTLSLMQDVKQVFKIPSVGDTYRELVWGRYSGSYLRGLVRTMGAKRYSNLQKGEKRSLPQTQVYSKPEETYLTVVSADVKFETRTIGDWTPAVTFEQSWQGIVAWLKEAGYLN